MQTPLRPPRKAKAPPAALKHQGTFLPPPPLPEPQLSDVVRTSLTLKTSSCSWWLYGLYRAPCASPCPHRVCAPWCLWIPASECSKHICLLNGSRSVTGLAERGSSILPSLGRDLGAEDLGFGGLRPSSSLLPLLQLTCGPGQAS